jgi:glycosyltransferase involved in cell wall biosynthesis
VPCLVIAGTTPMPHIVMVLIGDIRYDGRVQKEIRTLVTAGHRVELVVSDFGKNRYGVDDLSVNIHRIPMTLWSSPLRNFWEQLNFNRMAASIIKQLRPTHIHCHDLSSLPAGVWAKKTTKAKLIFDAHELMPESWGGIRETVWGFVERRCIPSCDQIIMPEKNRIAYFKRKYPWIPDPFLLENFPCKREIPNATFDLFRTAYPIKKDQKIILYSGTVGPGRHVEDLIASMRICTEEFVLVILGMSFKGYEKNLAANVRKLGLIKRIFFHDAVPYTKILQYMASCDIGTAFYRNTDVNNYYCASNKIYEYIALNKIVLTNNYPGLIEAVEQNRQGVCLREVTAKSLQEAYTRASDAALVTPGMKKFLWEDQQHVLTLVYKE